MNLNKINCQIVNILLDENNEFTNKYTSFIKGNIDYNNILEDYYIDKNMSSVKVDSNNQSICFCNPKFKISIFNSETKKNENYFEEVHIHCNDLEHFDNLVKNLKQSKTINNINEVEAIPHFNFIKDNLKNSELIIEPMTNEVSATKNLVNILSQKSDETIFRALVIHFCKLVDNVKDIDSNLIHNLDNIYKNNVIDNENLFFSSDVSDKLINMYNEEISHNIRVTQIPSNRINLGNDNYNISLADGQNYNL